MPMNEKSFAAEQKEVLGNLTRSERALGKRLQKARQTAGLTQQQLCQKAGLSYSTLAKIERGAIKSPSIFTIGQIAAVLGTSLDNLVGVTNSSLAAKKRSKSGASFAYFDQALAKKLGVSKLDWQQYYLEAVDPIAEMQELVGWVSKHYRLGLLSNIMPGFIDVMRSKGLIPDVEYAAVVDSSKVGFIKPERKIYEVAQKMADCPPDEILLVDDSRTNVMAAEKLGWHVLWFDDYRPAESAKRIRAVLEPAD